MKRAISSICPSVSSPTIPSANQMMWLTPRGIFEELLNFTAAHVGIAILVQQALLRREAGSSAVNFDRSSFEDDRMIENRNLQQRRHVFGDPIVIFVGLIFSPPAVKNPIIQCQRTFTPSGEKRRTVIPHPDIHGGNLQDRGILHYCANILES